MFRRRAFTLIELLVVIAIIMLLASLLLPSLQRAQELARRSLCLSQLRHLAIGWRTYVNEHDGVLPSPTTGGGWIDGGNDHDAIRNGLLFPYVGSVGMYHCPSDRSYHVRTYSLSDALGGGWPECNPVYRLDDVLIPADTLVFGEENDPRGSNWSSWVLFASGDLWLDWVVAWHDDGSNFSFADGHAEYWVWEDPRTLTIDDFGVITPDNPDLQRVQAHVNTW